jgi:hypothetical protein
MPLKPIDKSKNPGLAKLPTDVRNKMGYMKDGGAVGKAKGEDIQVKEVDALITQLRNKSKGMSSEALRTLKQRIKYNLGKKDGGMANKGKKEGTEAENLKRIEEQQKAQAKRADEASKAVKGYAREKARKMKEGGMVLEIGLRPATKSEMKMAKEMKPQKKANGGMVARGTGQAIRGKGFKGVF